MVYNPANDPENYQGGLNPNTSINYDLIAIPSRCYTVTPSTNELPRYAKALEIYVPTGITGVIQVVLLNDPDSNVVSLTFSPGNYCFKAFVRQVQTISGNGVIVTAMTD